MTPELQQFMDNVKILVDGNAINEVGGIDNYLTLILIGFFMMITVIFIYFFLRNFNKAFSKIFNQLNELNQNFPKMVSIMKDGINENTAHIEQNTQQQIETRNDVKEVASALKDVLEAVLYCPDRREKKQNTMDDISDLIAGDIKS